MFQRYLDHDHWHARWCDVNIIDSIRDNTIPIYRNVVEKPVLLVLHLFAGRRRLDDFHSFLAGLTLNAPFQVHILSLDTAIDKVYGNLSCTSRSWEEIQKLLAAGQVAAGLAGSPCETFSAARYWQPEEITEEETSSPSTTRRWPRPLRDHARPWGLPGLSLKELRQLRQGSQFAMQTLAVLTWILAAGGSFVSEHPFPPKDEWKVSVFRTPLAKLLLQIPEVNLGCYYQGDWGAGSHKPTGLMSVRMPRMFSSMWRHRDPTPVHERTAAIGVNKEGKFRTACLKEYPKAFSRGLAQSVFDALLQRWRLGEYRQALADPKSLSWLDKALEVSSVIRDDACMQPDYQPNMG